MRNDMRTVFTYISDIRRVHIARLATGIMIGVMVSITCAAYMAYNTVKTELRSVQVLRTRDTAALSQRHMLWYGEVESVDAHGETMTVLLRNQFVSSQEPVRFVVHTTQDTVFIQEKLIAENGAYVGLTSTLGHTIANIQPHTRVAMVIENTPEKSEVIASTVIFGNPL